MGSACMIIPALSTDSCIYICLRYLPHANCRKGGWQDVTIPMHRFLQTHKGRLVETRSEMNIHRILSLGISTASLGDVKQDGPFSLGIQNIKAKMQDVTPYDD